MKCRNVCWIWPLQSPSHHRSYLSLCAGGAHLGAYSKPRHAYTCAIHAVGQAYRTCADVDVRNLEEEIEEGAALRVCNLGSRGKLVT